MPAGKGECAMLTMIAAFAAMLASGFATPDAAVRAYGAAVAANDPAQLAAAFQPSAIMYCADGAAIRATSQGEWKQRMRTAGAPAGPIATSIAWIDSGATTAVARAVAVRGQTEYVDYLLLARLAGGWRIVGKACEAGARPDAAADAGVRQVVRTKLAADRTWDDRLLAESIDPRALVMTVDGGELVAATLGEWQARYVARRAASSGSPAVPTSLVVDARGGIGTARWSFRGTDGSEWTDRALMIRTPRGWRMVALAFAKEAPGAN